METQKTLQSIFEVITEPLLILDNKMRVKILNSAARKYFAIKDQKLPENSCCFQLFRQRQTPCRDCKIPSALIDREHLCFERQGFHDPQNIEQVTIHPLEDTPFTKNSSLMRIHDITNLRKKDKELAHTDKMIALGVLISNMAHETNNPNNFIMMNIQLLLDSWKSLLPITDQYYKTNGDFSMGGLFYSEMRTEIPELLKGIKKSSIKIKHIIKDFKNFTRDVDTPMDDAVNINDVIQKAMELSHKLIQKSTDCFTCKLEENLPTLEGNSQQLEQVVINLMGNACQAITGREKSIAISSALCADKKSIIIEVQDQGEGIPEHLLPKIMEPFFTTRRETGGTGLGLSISSKIIKKHGGKICVESKNGEGTSFKVFLPIHRSKILPRILIADDDAGSREIMQLILRRADRFKVQLATSGTETLLQIGQNKPDLILMDIHMPDMDGAQVCRVIKNRPELSSIKVIITTGFINSDKTEQISNLGFKTILEKPIDSKLLLKTIDSILEGKT